MAPIDTWRWDEASFILAWEAGVFRDRRVELVEGEVWPVTAGLWHGAVTTNLVRLLPAGEWRFTSASLPAAGSIPDPDLWIHHRRAEPVSRLGATRRIGRWSPDDVVLVVEVADASYAADIEAKARVYGRSGFPCYWVVHRAGVEELTDPYEDGYRQRASFGPGDTVRLPYQPDVSIGVDDVLDAET